MNKEQQKHLDKIITEQYTNMAGVVIYQNDNPLYSRYFNGYNHQSTVHIASVTKSILSILMGIAIDKGYIENAEQKVLDFFPEYTLKRGEKTIQKIRIKHLLTMTAPYKFKYEPYTKVYSSDDWTKASLDLLGGKSPIGPFKYTTVAIHILSGLLTRATKQSVRDFANENLFAPLGIETPPNLKIGSKEEHFSFLKDRDVKGWIIDPQGVNTAGWGLALTTGDLAKIGLLYLNKGLWNGNRILSSDWIEESTKKQSRWGELSYGYLWWMIDPKTKSYAALGDGGNVLYINQEDNIVIAMTSSFMPRAKDRLELIRNEIIPMIKGTNG